MVTIKMLCIYFHIQLLVLILLSIVKKGVSDCCLTTTQQFFSNIMALIFNEMMMRSACTRPTPCLEFYSASSLKQQSADRHVAPLGHIILSRANQFLLFFLNGACLAEKQQTPIL